MKTRIRHVVEGFLLFALLAWGGGMIIADLGAAQVAPMSSGPCCDDPGSCENYHGGSGLCSGSCSTACAGSCCAPL